MKLSKQFIIAGGILGMFGVAMGAFGAHGLQAILEANGRVDTFNTASRYQMYHALGLLLVGVLAERSAEKWLAWAGYAMFIGTLIFCGSLYILAVFNVGWMGAVAPLGGTALVISWALILLAGWKRGD